MQPAPLGMGFRLTPQHSGVQPLLYDFWGPVLTLRVLHSSLYLSLVRPTLSGSYRAGSV